MGAQPSFIEWLLHPITTRIEEKVDEMASELTEALTPIKDKLAAVVEGQAKGFNEVTAKIAELTALLAENPAALALVAEIGTLTDTLAGQTQALDDVVPDVEPEPVDPL